MNKKLVKNTAMLYIMNIAKIILPLVTLPYLTRVLSLGCYGTVSYVKNIMQYMQLIVDFGFVLSGTKEIVKLREDEDKLNEAVGTTIVAKLFLSSLALVALLICTFAIPLLRENILYTLLSFVPVFLTCFLFDFLFHGIDKMEVITIRFVIMKAISTLFTFIFVKNDSNVLLIPIFDIIGSLIAAVWVLFEVKRLKIKLKFGGFKSMFAKLKDSGVYFLSSIATTAFLALNTLLIGIFLTEKDVSFWSVCMQMITAVLMLYSPLTEGIYPHMVKHKDFGVVKKAMLIYGPIILVGCVFTLFVAKYALLIVGGEQYVAAENVLRALVPVLFFGFFSLLFGWPCLGAIGKQKQTTLSTIIAAGVQITGLGLLLAIGQFNLVAIAILRGVTEAALFGVRLGYCIQYRKEFNKQPTQIEEGLKEEQTVESNVEQEEQPIAVNQEEDTAKTCEE